MTRIGDRYFDAAGPHHRARSGRFPAFGDQGAQARRRDDRLPRRHQSGAGRHAAPAFLLLARLVQRHSEQGSGDLLVAALHGLHALGLRLYRLGDSRIRRRLDPDHPLAALADRELRRPLARSPHPLPDVAWRRRRQPRPAHFRGRQPLHQRRPGRLWHLHLLDPADLEFELAGVLRHPALGAVGEFHPALYDDRLPRLSVLGRADLCRNRHLDHPSHRPLAGRALLRAAAL